MLRLFLRVHWPAWRRSPLSFLLPALGVAVGVGAVIAIDLGSGSTVSSFRRTVERIEGRTTHQVLPRTGKVDPALAYALAPLPGVEAAAPILESWALTARPGEAVEAAEGGEPLRLLGLDPFAETGIRSLGLEQAEAIPGQGDLFLPFLARPGALMVSTPFLRRHGLAPGDSLQLLVGDERSTAFVLGALPQQVGGLRVPDNLALCDLATAQELSGRGDCSRIDLVLDGEEAAARVRAALPAGVGLEKPGGRAARLGEMVSALSANLRALSYLALFVSLFLIYNALLLAVLRRRGAIGLSRCLGATRGEVLGAWLLEGLALGVVGGVLGMGLGLLGGRLALGGVGATASGLYGYVRADTLSLVPATFLKAVAVGLVASLAAAGWPAAEAARTAPAHTSARGDLEIQAGRRRAWAPVGAVLLVGGAVALLGLPSASPLPGYGAAVLLALAAGLLTPALAHGVLGVLVPPLRRLGPLPALAARNIRASMSRTGVALAALGVALSMSVAMGTMVGSFRQEMVEWIGRTVAADVYVSPATARLDRTRAHLEPALVDSLRRRPGVVAVDTIRGEEVTVDGRPTFVAGVEMDAYRRRTEPRILDGPSPAAFLRRIAAGEAGITESLHRKIALGAGDTLTLRLGEVAARLPIAGVYRDYSSDQGAVLLDRSTFEAVLGPRDPNGAALYLGEGVDAEDFVQRLKADLAGRWSLLIRSNRSLRQEALDVFDRTFAVSRALEVIGICVAAIGILSALLAMLLERRRELATLRAVALTRAQLDRLLLMESALLAGLAWALALGLGSALAWILLRVINVRSFGWSLPFALPVESWLANLLFALLAAGAATLYPMLRSRRLPVAQALREE